MISIEEHNKNLYETMKEILDKERAFTLTEKLLILTILGEAIETMKLKTGN